MSDREAFEKWYQDTFKRPAIESGYETYLTWQAWQAAQDQAGERKCSECGNGEPDLSLYCVRCLNNDHWHLIDPDQAGDGEALTLPTGTAPRRRGEK